MSPAALGGAPHTRASNVNGGGPISTETGLNGTVTNGIKSANRIFPHLNDLISVRPDVDLNSTIRKIMVDAESLAKQADTHLDFHRPDMALQEYIKAAIITIEIIPRHRDFPGLQSDRGELHRLYMGLKKRINAQHDKFGEVKELIKENNARSGVKPKSAVTEGGADPIIKSNGLGNTHSRTGSGSDHIMNGTPNGTPPKKKPPIQPKPDALHGKALLPASDSSQTDLAARFARLRSPEATSPVQDPRIRTQPIPDLISPKTGSPISQIGNYTTTSRPSGPREMPSVPKTLPHPTKIPLDVQIPDMPRAPDAIYSPARNPDNVAAANLPSSIPRTSSYLVNGRKNSAPPISTVGPTPTAVEDRLDYFTSSPQKRQEITFPDSTTITADELVEYLKLGSKAVRLLLVDLRSRDQYDNGHIMSQSIICVEPITLRRGISGEELGDTMVIAPDSEQNIYEKRDEFDLVIFYDQSSTSMKAAGSPEDAHNSLTDFSTAVYDFGYSKRLKRRPVLLIGGLDAWVDLMGQNSLRLTSTGVSSANKSNLTQKPARPLTRVPKARDFRQSALRKRVESRVLSKEEEKKWDETLRMESRQGSLAIAGNADADGLYYSRTTDDFFRRYPDISSIQESMVSSLPHPTSTDSYAEVSTSLPKPPARPPPALPRQRSSGLSERGPSVIYSPAHTLETSSITKYRVPPGLTGLHNPGMLCYMNSSLQALSHTPFFRDLVKDLCWPLVADSKIPEIPKKENEVSEPPQLMVRNLSHVLSHMWSGQYDWISPKTFARYVNAVHMAKLGSPDRSLAFGGPEQQDAPEFLLFLLDILEDETNTKRNINSRVLSEAEIKKAQSFSTLKESRTYWDLSRETNDSPIMAKTRGQYVRLTTCIDCSARSSVFGELTQLEIGLSAETPNYSSVYDLIAKGYGDASYEIIDARCEEKPCKSDKKTSWVYFTILPDYLLVNFNRYTNERKKLTTMVTFPETGLDLSPLFLRSDVKNDGPLLREQKGPFLYDVYAVLQHAGATITQGHFWAIAKSPDRSDAAGSWHKYNDSTVTPAKFADTQSSQTYYILLRRQGAA